MSDHWDARLKEALNRDVADLSPRWSRPEADADWFARVVSEAQRIPRWRARFGDVRSLGLRAVAGAAAVALFFGLGHYFNARGTAGTPVLDVLAQDTAAILNQPVTPANVSLSEPTAQTALLTNLGGGHWNTILFKMVGTNWVPVSVTDKVAGLTLTYEVATGPNDPGVLLPYAEMKEIEQHLGAMPYNAAKDSQQGALERMPMNFSGALLQKSLDQAKLVLTLGNQEILALTYITKTASGQLVFLPIGWYWWKGAPAVMTQTVPALPSSPSSAVTNSASESSASPSSASGTSVPSASSSPSSPSAPSASAQTASGS